MTTSNVLIRKIKSIKNSGVFKDFKWQGKESQVKKDFKRVNIFYGRNYSGKTTLSRIFRSLEQETPPEGWEFTIIKQKEGEKQKEDEISHTSCKDHGLNIRVFNKDFIKEHLAYIYDETKPIDGFAIFGKENVQLEQEIKELKEEIKKRREEEGTAKEKHTEAETACKKKDAEYSDFLSSKAIAIKKDERFKKTSYRKDTLEKDIQKRKNDEKIKLNEEKKKQYEQTLKEEKKDPAHKLEFTSNDDHLQSHAKDLIERNITSETLQRFKDHPETEGWVEKGLHSYKKEQDGPSPCPFCESLLEEEFWEKLTGHFNKETEQIKEDLEQLTKKVEKEEDNVKRLKDSLNSMQYSSFYSNYQQNIENLNKKLTTSLTSYSNTLAAIKGQINKREQNISQSFAFKEPEGDASSVAEDLKKLNEAIADSNEYTDKLAKAKEQARRALFDHEIFQISDEIKSKEGEKVRLDEAQKIAKETWDKAKADLEQKAEKLTKKKQEFTEEAAAIEKINEYLQKWLGGHITLAIEKGKDDTEQSRFKVCRDGDKERSATNLSDGELNILAFCYFMAKLEEVSSKEAPLIVYLDDPVSSLDSNHIFGIYSLIAAKIVENTERYVQLFISTHKLDFLKYLISFKDNDNGKKDKDKGKRMFLISRGAEGSKIEDMPEYLKKHATEFNYLFKEIKEYANAKDNSKENYFHIGNTMRRFLETYLYYKYPDQSFFKGRLKEFFSDDQYLKIERMINEYSHGFFEHTGSDITPEELRECAKLILTKIEKDQTQYEKLCKSTTKKGNGHQTSKALVLTS